MRYANLTLTQKFSSKTKKTWALTHNCLEIQLPINIHNNDSNKCKK